MHSTVPSPPHDDGYLYGLHQLETSLSQLLVSDGGHILLGPNLPLTLFMRTDGTMELKRVPLCERIAPQLPPLASPLTALMWGDGLAGSIRGNTLKDGRSRALILFHGLLQHFLDPSLFRYALPFNASGYGTSSALAVKRHAHLILKLLSLNDSGGSDGSDNTGCSISIWPTVVRLAEQVVVSEKNRAANTTASNTPHLMVSSLRQYFSSSLSPSLASSFAVGCSDLLQQLAEDDCDQTVVCERVLRDFDAYVTFDDQGAGSDVQVCDAFSMSFRDCRSGVQIDPPEEGSQPPHHHFIILRVSGGGWCGVEASDDSSSEDDDEGGGVDRMAVMGDMQLHDKEAQHKRFIQTLAVIAKCGVRAVLTSATLPDWWSPPATGSKSADGKASSSTVSLTLPTRDGPPITYNMDVVHSLDRADIKTMGRRLCGHDHGKGGARFDTLDVYPGMTNQEIGEALVRPIGSVYRKVPFTSMASSGHRHGADQQYLSIKGASIPQFGHEHRHEDAPRHSSTNPPPPLLFLRIPVASCKLIRTWRLVLLGGFSAALSNLQEGFVAGGGWHPAALSHALKAEVTALREGIANLHPPPGGAQHAPHQGHIIERCDMLLVLSNVLLRIPVNLCPTATLKRQLVKKYTSYNGNGDDEDVCGVLFHPNGKGADVSIATAGRILEVGIVEAGGDLLKILRTVMEGLSAILHIDGVYQV